MSDNTISAESVVKAFHTNFKSILMEKRKGLVALKENHKQPLCLEEIEPEDRSRSQTDRVRNLTSIEEQLKDVDRALKKIENYTFGMCERCKKPIDEQRLIAHPTAKRCMPCHVDMGR